MLMLLFPTHMFDIHFTTASNEKIPLLVKTQNLFASKKSPQRTVGIDAHCYNNGRQTGNLAAS